MSTRHYDSLTLALRLLDAVVESTGMEDELDHEGARRVLGPLLRAMDRAAGVDSDAERYDEVVRRLLAALQNDRAGREPFDISYFDVTPDWDLVTRHVTFRLLSDYHVAGPGDGRIVLRLSNEAINLVLNALNLDLADAQAAAEALVESQLQRGRFDDALRSAQNARVRSIRYSASIDEQLDRTQRDVRRVDWREMMPRQLEDARLHIELRLRTEESILDAAERTLDDLPPGTDKAHQVAQIVRLMRDCRGRHMELHGRLMCARAVFLEAQGRQVFSAARALARPDLAAQVLAPLLAAPVRTASRATDSAFRVCHPPVPPGVLTITDLVHWQLRPRREIGPVVLEVANRDLVGYGSDPAFFSAEVRHAAMEHLAAITEPVSLSGLLHDVADNNTSSPNGEPRSTADLLALIVLQAFAPDIGESAEGGGHDRGVASSDELARTMATFRIDRIAGSELRIAGYLGDDLRLVRLESLAHEVAHATTQ